MGIDGESSHPELCSEVADGVTRNIVCLFREPDAWGISYFIVGSLSNRCATTLGSLLGKLQM